MRLVERSFVDRENVTENRKELKSMERRGANSREAVALTVAGYVELPYAPTLLLDSRFGAWVTDDAAFRSACRIGFEVYSEGRCERDSDGKLMGVEQPYTWAEIVGFVVEQVLYEDRPGYCASVGWRAGFVLGWLSALALVNRAEALRALVVLRALVLSAPIDGTPAVQD